MASWGSLRNIFDNRVSDPLSSWSQLLPRADTVDASFDMFGEFCHCVRPAEPSEAPTPHRFNKSFSWNTTMSEPDENAFEIFGELCYKTKPEAEPGVSSLPEPPAESRCTEGLGLERTAANANSAAAPDAKKGMMYRRSYSDVRSRSTDGGLLTYPPPITTIGRCGKPRVYFKSYREDGRFVLREIRIPTQQLLHSTRENGRLRMQVVVPDEQVKNAKKGEGQEEEEEEEENEGEEKLSNTYDGSASSV